MNLDEFLIDEAAQIVKGALAQRGYLQPMVMARVVTEGEHYRRLLIDVMPEISAPRRAFVSSQPSNTMFAAAVYLVPGTYC